MTGVGVVGLLFGGFSFIVGVVFRTGLIQGNLAWQYRDPAAPNPNGIFALIPFGIGWCAAGAFPLVADAVPFGATLALGGIWWAGWIFGLVVLRRPPWWMKPQWLRKAEAEQWSHYKQPPFPLGLQLIGAAPFVLVMSAGLAFMLSHATQIELVGAILAGLGVAGFFGGRAQRRRVAAPARDSTATIESERERRELVHHIAPREVIDDPANRLVLRRSRADIAWMSAAGVLLILLFAVELVWLRLLGHPPIVADLLFALLCFFGCAAGVIGIVAIATSRLTLTPEGFRFHHLGDEVVWWIDVEEIRAVPSAARLRNQPVVSIRLTPAGRARARPGLIRLLNAYPLRIPLFAMSCDEQASLMEQWRQRWTFASRRPA
jgi:hypothetical protein